MKLSPFANPSENQKELCDLIFSKTTCSEDDDFPRIIAIILFCLCLNIQPKKKETKQFQSPPNIFRSSVGCMSIHLFVCQLRLQY